MTIGWALLGPGKQADHLGDFDHWCGRWYEEWSNHDI